MEDYEQLYYDSLYTIKKLKQQNETLEDDLQLVNKNKIKDVKMLTETMIFVFIFFWFGLNRRMIHEV